jgi:hypothetical protein
MKREWLYSTARANCVPRQLSLPGNQKEGKKENSKPLKSRKEVKHMVN